MRRLRSNTGPAFVLLMAAALAVSVFFQGFEVAVFSGTMALILAALTLALWRGKHAGHVLPGGWLPLALMLFWCWLGATVLWSPVPYVSVLDFWWIGALPLAFWSLLLLPESERPWRGLEWGAFALGLALAVTGLIQLFGFSRPPAATFLNINSYASLLNLIALPLAARVLWLLASGRGREGRWLTAGLLVLVLALALTRGRAASLSFLIGYLLLMLAVCKQVPGKMMARLSALVLGAFAAAFMSAPGAFTERYAEMYTPLVASSMVERQHIWTATWRMIADTPWWGAGTGIFSLAYPAYRSPLDGSAGYLVHNDYLQLWYEAGIPGLLLFAAVLLMVLWRFVRVMRRAGIGLQSRIEIAGLFAGLFAIALHAVVDFPFHVITILILAGLMLARFHVLTGQALASDHIAFRPLPFLSARAYRLVTGLLLLFPLLYLVCITAAVTLADHAQALAREGRLDEADQAYARAYRLYPYADNVLVNHADLYRHVLAVLPRERVEDRRQLYSQATDWLDRAERLNPLRPLSPLVRAGLIDGNRDLAGDQAPALAEKAFRRALELNPRYYHGRYAYARFLAGNGRRQEADALLEEGMHQHYKAREDIVPFYLLVREIRERRGDKDGTSEMDQRIKAALAASGWRWTPLPEAAATLERPQKPAEKQEP